MKQNAFKNFMSFSRSERIAIITIVSAIVIILIIKYLITNNPPERNYYKHDLDSIVARREFVMDSVRRADSIERANVKRNEIPRYARNDKESSFRPKRNEMEHSGEILNSAKQLKNKDYQIVIDLNAADTTLLKELPGIGSSFAKRIVEYRTKLGGFCESGQLLEVYGMDSSRYEGIKDFVKTDSTFTPNRLRINSDEFKKLLKHPYLEYEDVKKIVNYREQKGLITSWEQLKKVVGDGINPRLRYYVDYQ
ncbi:MAG: helix-hairpin-helix domain-containing protein [Bacteroidales bacterium]|nr:helix-hairpin-helix domain-containing protein [Bacteroidales bacterium]